MPKALWSALGALAAVGLLASCAPDPDPEPGTANGPTSTSTSEPIPTDTTSDNVPRVGDDCPPEAASIEVPSAWPSVLVTSTSDGENSEPIELALTDVIDASCFTVAPTYAAAFDIPIPEFGEVSTAVGAVLRYQPDAAPDNVREPQAPWWGEDRVRVCIELDGGRQGCTNIDIRTLRSDVADLRDRFEVSTFPLLTTPATRAGMRDEGVSPGGIARLQDAYAAEWALQLVAETVDLPQPPLQLAAACDASGTELDDLIAAGQALLGEHAELVDATAVAVTATMGTEPEPDLSARADAALGAVGAWIACEI